MGRGSFSTEYPTAMRPSGTGLDCSSPFLGDEIESSSPSRYKAKCQSFRLDDYDDALFISSGNVGLRFPRKVRVTRFANGKKVSGFDGRSGFILENMKHKEKKTLKNIGRALTN